MFIKPETLSSIKFDHKHSQEMHVYTRYKQKCVSAEHLWAGHLRQMLITGLKVHLLHWQCNAPGISSSPCVLEAILGQTQQMRVAGPTGPALAPCCCPGWAVPPALYPEWAILRDPSPGPFRSSAGTAPPSGSPQTHSREEPDRGYEGSQEEAIEGQRNTEKQVRQNVCKDHVSNEQQNLRE